MINHSNSTTQKLLIDSKIIQHALIAATILATTACMGNKQLEKYEFTIPVPTNLIDLNQSVELPSPQATTKPIDNKPTENKPTTPLKPVTVKPTPTTVAPTPVEPTKPAKPVTVTPTQPTAPTTPVPPTPVIADNPPLDDSTSLGNTPAPANQAETTTYRGSFEGKWLSMVDYSINQNLFILDRNQNKILIGKLIQERFEKARPILENQPVQHRSIQNINILPTPNYPELYSVHYCQQFNRVPEIFSIKPIRNMKDGSAVFVSTRNTEQPTTLTNLYNMKEMRALFEPNAYLSGIAIKINKNSVQFPTYTINSKTIQFSIEQLLSQNNPLQLSLSQELLSLISNIPNPESISLLTENSINISSQWVRLENSTSTSNPASLGSVTYNGTGIPIDCLYSSDTVYPGKFAGQDTKLRSVRYWIANNDSSLNWDIQYHQIDDLNGNKLYSMENFWNSNSFAKTALTLEDTLNKQANDGFKATTLCALQSKDYHSAADCIQEDYLNFQKDILTLKLKNNTTNDIFYSNLMKPNTLFQTFDINSEQHIIDFQTSHHSGKNDSNTDYHSINIKFLFSR